MKHNLFYIASRAGAYLFVIMFIALISSVFSVAAGVSIAIVGAPVMDAPVTTTATNTGSPDLLENYVSQRVIQMKPASTPLDTIMRQIKNVPIKSWKTEYYAADSRPLNDELDTAYARVDATNYDHTAAFTVKDISMWAIDDTLMFPNITVTPKEGTVGPLVGLVVGRTVATSTLTVQCINGAAGSGTNANLATGCFPATIADNSLIVRMGAAKAETDAQTTPYGIIPVPAYNYCQIFMAQCEESLFQQVHDKQVSWSLKDYEAQNIYDMRATMEHSYLFGARQKFADLTSSKERYLTGGATTYIDKVLTYGSGGSDRTIDDDTFVQWTKDLFTGNSGSETRILFGGDGLLKNLSNVKTVQKQIDAKSTQVKFGLTFKEIETSFGTLLFYHHKLLNMSGWSDNGIVLDINNIEKHVFSPMEAKKLNLADTGQRNVNATRLSETSCLVLRYPDTHAVIKPAA